ncbi:DUF6468 domain-containing protein [Thalassospira sp. MCCC 1A03138]|uniref:DUF6468 domain-containing protein n=1 Tax=Thalassospira sp. MCCC 1A03138 TaxID=1470576 RepID=UPI000A1E6547|nr:DUF6468 domain-containing protein [Thalassospira sp. MCCC 1A03138]OSQ32390.1 hypothetical protein TH468_01995 [Thalassospira sp. MCCC 1A03138]
MDYAIYLDLVMIVLLIATIIYAMILSRRLAAFRRNREEMQNFLTAFNAANERAEVSIRALKEMAEQSGEKLREDIEKASGLHEDLSFMVDRGESIANRLEKAASDVNATRRGAGEAKFAEAGNATGKERNNVVDDRQGVETRAEELAARLMRDVERGTMPGASAPSSAEPAGGGYGSGMRSGGSPLREPASDPYEQDEDAGRSEAERELLAALRSVR